MLLVTVNYYFDQGLATPNDLLDRYPTLTGWAEAVARAGADVTVVQRYSRDAEVDRAGIRYLFVRCGMKRPRIFDTGGRVNHAVRQLQPDIIHVNGLQFMLQAWWLKRLLPHTPLLLQDHADTPPRSLIGRAAMRVAWGCAAGVSFAAADLACPWTEARLFRVGMPVVELMEGSTDFQLLESGLGLRPASMPSPAPSLLRGEGPGEVRPQAGPRCVWVGRLDDNKDPLTVLRGFALAMEQMPKAQLVMVFQEAPLLPRVKEFLASNPSVASHVTLLGSRPHAELEEIYNSAEFCLLGSHHESTGYAVIEAMACGVVPIVTDIPSFRVLLDQGRTGGLWPVGDADAMAHTLTEWAARWQPETPGEMRTHFEEHWSFDAIGRKALTAYTSLVEGK